MAHEVTAAAGKQGRGHGGRTPMQLLTEAVDTYEATAMARWWEWEEASDGRRQLTWSRGQRDLRALAGLVGDATDQEIAEQDQEADARLGLTSDTWAWLTVGRREVHLLEVAERRGLGGAREWLERYALAYIETRRPPALSPREPQPVGRYPYLMVDEFL